jgi:hypothetical protein
MTDAESRDQANAVIERLFALDDAMKNVEAFCALLRDMDRRDLADVGAPHAHAIHMVRAGILRAAIGTVMACLDPKDWRGNRASVGQILDGLEDEMVVGYLASVGLGSTAALQRARESYDHLLSGALFKRSRTLRNVVVAHNLMRETANATASLASEDIYELAEIAERITVELYAACGRGKPDFLYYRDRTAQVAKVFWDTYFLGMQS